MQDRGILPHGVVHREDGLEHLVVHVDEVEGLLGDVRVRGRHGRHRVALVEHLLVRQVVLRHHPGIALGLYEIETLLRNDGKVHGGGNGLHAGQGLGLAGVDGANTGVGVGAAEDLAVQQSGHVDVGRVPARPVTLSRPS